MRASLLLTIVVAPLAIGCAAGRAGGPPHAGEVRPRHILTAEQIDPGEFANAYQLVAHLRPEFLRTRGPSPYGAGVLVYLDGMRLGGIEELHHVRASSVAEIRYLTAPQASIRFGTGHPAGAILIALGTRRPRAQ